MKTLDGYSLFTHDISNFELPNEHRNTKADILQNRLNNLAKYYKSSCNLITDLTSALKLILKENDLIGAQSIAKLALEVANEKRYDCETDIYGLVKGEVFNYHPFPEYMNLPHHSKFDSENLTNKETEDLYKSLGIKT